MSKYSTFAVMKSGNSRKSGLVLKKAVAVAGRVGREIAGSSKSDSGTCLVATALDQNLGQLSK